MINDSVISVPVLEDNYAYIVPCGGGRAAIVDPGDASPVERVLAQRNLRPSHILLTHYDYDHIGGVGRLVSNYDCRVIGPAPASGVKLDAVCRDGEEVDSGDLRFRVIDTKGHAYPHVAFYEAARGWLFSGDCLFGGGCGRVSGKGYGDMFVSLRRLADLPGTTEVYFGHEYTVSNLRFALSVEPQNEAVSARLGEAVKTLGAGGVCTPTTLAAELATNPFLRTSSSAIRAAVAGGKETESEVFGALRRAKNSFRG